MIDEQLLTQLEELVNSIDLSVIPYQKGNSIRIKHFVIRKSWHGYLIYDTKENKQVTSYYSKTAAVAHVHCCIHKQNYSVDDIRRLDNTLSKHHIDSLFYKNTIETTKDKLKYDVAELRLDIALHHTTDAKAKLMQYILG
ncbi:MAG: hypothetical protein CMN33_07285 [Saprospirales bacterium]|nr:hypothetical protein [Saprospirales bacterium]|tara:strand:+ start:3978 stop:4397 length:420 start_codon:yes stop_codon:yes gene_type:complete